MMGVYIKGMEMPTRCLKCDWCAHTIPADNYICYRLNRAVIGVAEEDVNETVNACCPLIHVPEHGRLIEKNAIFELIRSFPNVDRQLPVEFMKALYELPTILEAEEGET